MKLYLALAVSAALLVPTGVALAQPVSTITDKAGVGHDGRKFKDKDGRLCKRMVITGSRMPQKKVCKTAKEWEVQESVAKKELDDQLRRNLTTVCVGGPGNVCIKGQ
ncbi:MAG TPA: hypothetical protein VEA44_04380 [Caulobacter sp.]|nr:hypothetical protein [Caulobacter sp.]